MARYPDLIEETMELTDDGGYLSGKIAGVHCSEVVTGYGQQYNTRRYRVLHDDSSVSKRSYHIDFSQVCDSIFKGLRSLCLHTRNQVQARC